MARLRLDINSIFTRLLISLLLIIAPVILVGVILFSWEMATIKSEIEHNTMANVAYIRQNLEAEVQNIKELQYDLASDQMLIKLVSGLNAPRSDYYTMISDVQRRLLVLKNSNILIQDVIVYFPNLGHCISVLDGYITLDSQLYEPALNCYIKARYPLVVIDPNSVCAMAAYPPSAIPSDQLLFLIEIKLSVNKIRGILTQFYNYTGSEIALQDGSSQYWIFGSSDSLISKSQIQLPKPQTGEPAIISGTVRLEGNNYFTATGFPKYLNLAIAEYVPLADIFQIPKTFEYLLWIYSALAVLVLVVYASMTHQSVKRPLDKIIQAFQRLEGGDLNVHIQFKAANEFNYLYEEFNNTIDCLNSLIDNNYKQRLYAQKAELRQLQSQISLHFLYNSYFRGC